MADYKPTDEKLHEELTNSGCRQDKDNPNLYHTKSIFDTVETDGKYHRVNGGTWY